MAIGSKKNPDKTPYECADVATQARGLRREITIETPAIKGHYGTMILSESGGGVIVVDGFNGVRLPLDDDFIKYLGEFYATVKAVRGLK